MLSRAKCLQTRQRTLHILVQASRGTPCHLWDLAQALSPFPAIRRHPPEVAFLCRILCTPHINLSPAFFPGSTSAATGSRISKPAVTNAPYVNPSPAVMFSNTPRPNGNIIPRAIGAAAPFDDAGFRFLENAVEPSGNCMPRLPPTSPRFVPRNFRVMYSKQGNTLTQKKYDVAKKPPKEDEYVLPPTPPKGDEPPAAPPKDDDSQPNNSRPKADEPQSKPPKMGELKSSLRKSNKKKSSLPQNGDESDQAQFEGLYDMEKDWRGDLSVDVD